MIDKGSSILAWLANRSSATVLSESSLTIEKKQELARAWAASAETATISCIMLARLLSLNFTGLDGELLLKKKRYQGTPYYCNIEGGGPLWTKSALEVGTMLPRRHNRPRIVELGNSPR